MPTHHQLLQERRQQLGEPALWFRDSDPVHVRGFASASDQVHGCFAMRSDNRTDWYQLQPGETIGDMVERAAAELDGPLWVSLCYRDLP